MNSTNNATKSRRGGFTLVELLIVIIIIAILAGMMMLTTGSATDRAEATKIISDLRNLKAAGLMYYTDHNVWPGNDGPTGGGGNPPIPATGVSWVTSLEKYLDRSMDAGRYKALSYFTTADGRMGIGFTLKDSVSAGVLSKLEDSAGDAGLYIYNMSKPYYYATNTKPRVILVPMK